MCQAARQLVFDVRPIRQRPFQKRYSKTLTETKPRSVHTAKWRPRMGMTSSPVPVTRRREARKMSRLTAFKIRRLQARLQSILKDGEVSASAEDGEVIVLVTSIALNLLQARLLIGRLNDNTAFRRHFEPCHGLKQVDGGFEFLTAVR